MAVSYKKYRNLFHDSSSLRLRIVLALVIIIAVGILVRLFEIQIIDNDKYYKIAKQQHRGRVTIRSRRGEILSYDRDQETVFKLATNTTLDLLYVDPSVSTDKEYVAKVLSPYVLTVDDYEKCSQDERYCPLGLSLEKILLDLDLGDMGVGRDDIRIRDSEKHKTKSYEEALLEIEVMIKNKIAKDEVDYSILKNNLDEDTLKKIFNLHFSGVFVDFDKRLVFVNPTLIPERDFDAYARALSIILEISFDRTSGSLEHRKIRYVPLKRKLSPDVSVAIVALLEEAAEKSRINPMQMNPLRGVVLQPESWRYYPNSQIAAQVIGFHSQELGGQYGLEEAYNRELQGKSGTIVADSDPFNRPISFGDSEVVNPENGESFIITLVLPLQKKVEQILEEAVKKYNADKAHVIIMDPFTGAILAMAQYPTFDPNEYYRVFEKEEIKRNDVIPITIPLFVRDEDGSFREADDEERVDKKIDRYVYKNRIGPMAYRNEFVQTIYEPGSVFKPITMSVALDRKLVTPSEIMCDRKGFLEVDDFTIYNAEKSPHGCMSMTNVLEKSSNMGMAYVGKKLGKPLFYSYIKDFGFGEYTDIELPDELPGKVVAWKQWSEAKLITISFGQGISATPLQVVTAWSVLANGGLLMQPHVVHTKIKGDLTEVRFEPRVIRRVIGQETAGKITSMLVSAIDNGVARPARLDKLYASGKTGTSQIARTNELGYEKGEGSFITSFAGYLPVHHPKFVILVKFDRPRIGKNTYGSTTAAPVFKEIAEYLISYFDLPPDRESFVGMSF